MENTILCYRNHCGMAKALCRFKFIQSNHLWYLKYLRESWASNVILLYRIARLNLVVGYLFSVDFALQPQLQLNQLGKLFSFSLEPNQSHSSILIS